MNNITADWLQAATDDLAAIEAMLPNEQLTNIIAFHAQQAVEKAFKGLREKFGLRIPRTHDLLVLYDGLSEQIQAAEDTLDSLNELYIDARYPGDIGLLPHGKPTTEEARAFYLFAQEIVKTAMKLNQKESEEPPITAPSEHSPSELPPQNLNP